jgi:ubiquinone/menaquinone biosynthesis C-methylase UbiE
VVLREAAARLGAQAGTKEEWRRQLRGEFPRFVPFLVEKCGVDFFGRILEIGAGGAWFSAELSKLPRVVEIVAMDLSTSQLKEQAPEVFRLAGAQSGKITRTPGDFHRLDFPDNHFDFVVCSAALRHAASVVQVLREAKRVLKPGGRFVAIREPVQPLVRLKSRVKVIQKLVATGVADDFHTLSDFREFFRQAGLPLQVKRVNLSTGLKYYVNELVNGLTHARYAFIGSKPSPQPRPAAPPARKPAVRIRRRARDRRPLSARGAKAPG